MSELETLKVEQNVMHGKLEIARRANDADSAQAVCYELGNLYRRQALTEIQREAEKEGKIL